MSDHPSLLERNTTLCALAHGFYNQLTVIIAHCDFLTEECAPSSTALNHLSLIATAPREMAKALSIHECQLYETIQMIQTAGVKRASGGATAMTAVTAASNVAKPCN